MPAPIPGRDERVLEHLRENSTASLVDAAEALGMSDASVRRAVRALERAGRLRRTPTLGGPSFYQVLA
jgi:DNA-binding Lrp family transcriptional regulator